MDMAEQKYLLFDYGASHGRCMVAKFDGRRIVMEDIHEFDNIPVNYAGTLYWDILRLVNELKVGVKKAFALHPDIRSIGIDTWGCDFGFVDRHGLLMGNPVNYRDEARYHYKDELDNLFGHYELFKLGGANLNNIMGLYELYANTKEDSTILKTADRLLMIPDLLNYSLTGVPANEYTNATMTLMVDQSGKVWAKGIWERLKFPPQFFKDLMMPGTKIGGIRRLVTDELDVPSVPVIGVATHDTASAIAGVPLSGEKHWAFLSFGTWAILGVEGDKVYKDERTYASGFANQGGCDGKTNFVNLFSGLWVIQQCYERWNSEAGKKIGWDSVIDSVKGAKGGIAFIDLDSVDFAQPNPNMPLLIQEYCKKHGMPAPDGMGEIARCVYESLILKVKKHFEEMKSLTGSEIETLYVFGGGSKSAVVCQWLADALKVHIKSGPAETTSVGNVLMQMKGMGDISSLNEGRVISAQSAVITEYDDAGDARWEQYYAPFLKAIAN
jgi:sugar (pentulose or hexulose) kinase